MVLCWYCLLIVSGTLCVFCLWKVVYKYFSYSLTSRFYHVWSVFLFLLAKAISTFTAYHIISFWVYSVWKVSCCRPPDDVVSQGPLHSWSSPSLLSSSPPAVFGLPPDAERESASGSSLPHGHGFYQLSVCPKHTRMIKKEAKTLKHCNSGCTVHTSLFRRSFLTLSML